MSTQMCFGVKKNVLLLEITAAIVFHSQVDYIV